MFSWAHRTWSWYCNSLSGGRGKCFTGVARRVLSCWLVVLGLSFQPEPVAASLGRLFQWLTGLLEGLSSDSHPFQQSGAWHGHKTPAAKIHRQHLRNWAIAFVLLQLLDQYFSFLCLFASPTASFHVTVSSIMIGPMWGWPQGHKRPGNIVDGPDDLFAKDPSR